MKNENVWKTYGEKELQELNEEYCSWENMEVSEDYR